MNARPAAASASTRVIAVLAVLHMFAFIDRTVLAGVLPLVRQTLPMNDAQAGWLIGTAFAIPYAATALLVAAVMRGRPASMWLLVGGVLTWTAGAVAMAAAGSVLTFSLARALLGIGQGVFVPLAVSWLVDHSAARRAPALAAFASGATIGRSIALLLVGGLLWALALAVGDGPIAHWRWLLALTAIPNLLLLPMLPLAPRGAPAAAPTTPALPRSATPPWRTLAGFFAVAIAPPIVAQAVGGWLPTLFVRQAGMTAAQAATLLGIVTLLTGWTGQVVAGWALARRPTLTAALPQLVLLTLATTLLPLAVLTQVHAVVAMVACVVLVNLLLGISAFAGLFGVQALIPPLARASVNGVYFALVTLVAVGTGPLLAGVLAQGGLSTAAALLGTATIATIACALAVVANRPSFRRACWSAGEMTPPLGGR